MAEHFVGHIEMPGLEGTGRALRFAAGQAIERWGVGDSLGMMHQLGVLG